MIAALSVGDQVAIEREDWELFRSTGLSHLMAISGLHVTMFAWLAAALVGRFWRVSPRAMLALPAPQAARWGGLAAAAAYAVFGRLACAWSEGKQHGIDAIELATKTRATLTQGGVFYRTLSPSPDGRFLVVTRSWDTGLDPLAIIFGGQREEIPLLDVTGRERGSLEASRRHANHSPDWGR